MRTLLLSVLLTGSFIAPSPRPTLVERHYPNGRLASREYFAAGRKVGRHETWWPDGQLRSRSGYVDDAFQGEYRTWRDNGHPYELRHFDHGREVGVQQSWNDDGTLFLNYEVRDGRRYGFVNSSPCLPVNPDGTPRQEAQP